MWNLLSDSSYESADELPKSETVKDTTFSSAATTQFYEGAAALAGPMVNTATGKLEKVPKASSDPPHSSEK